MNARQKMNRLVGKTLGVVSYLIEEVRKPSIKKPGKDVGPSEMVRVTDTTGREYLCPTGKLKEANFVSENEKRNCVDYSVVTHNEVL